MASLKFALQNQTTSSNVVAYITGQAIDKNNALFLLQSDGHTAYYPTSPSSTGQPLQANCAITLGAPGSTTNVTIPHLAGARLWFCVNDVLTFLLNPGPALVEPSVNNTNDPNINKQWDFCEFTFNSSQLYANISYVDFVCLPISLTLTNASGKNTHVSGMNTGGLKQVINGLQAQSSADGMAGWGKLVVNNGLRVVAPGNGGPYGATFAGYFEPYVNSVWTNYTGKNLSVDTQASYGVVQGSVQNNVLTFPSGITFAKPSTADILSCSSGPFQTGSNGEVNAIIPRLAAGFNRTTLLSSNTTPDPSDPGSYYQSSPTNHYARVVHAANLDGKGYSFPYDDVAPSGGADQSGSVFDGAPTLLTVAVGGGNATS